MFKVLSDKTITNSKKGRLRDIKHKDKEESVTRVYNGLNLDWDTKWLSLIFSLEVIPDVWCRKGDSFLPISVRRVGTEGGYAIWEDLKIMKCGDVVCVANLQRYVGSLCRMALWIKYQWLKRPAHYVVQVAEVS